MQTKTFRLARFVISVAACLFFAPPGKASTFTDANWVSMNPSFPGTDVPIISTNHFFPLIGN